MRKSRCLLLGGIFLAGCTATQVPLERNIASETFLRRLKVAGDLPQYPEDAVRSRRTGVAVARIQLNEGGYVSSVDVLESPSNSVSQAVSDSLSKWRFKSYFSEGTGRQVTLSGLLTFYFEIQDGLPLVLEPANAGYVGLWPPLSAKNARAQKSIDTTNTQLKTEIPAP